MNYIYILLEVLIVFLLMIFSYKYGKKDGLYVYIGFMSAIGSIIVGTVDILSFQVSIGIPIIMGIFICSNVIIQRYGIDEVKRILYTYGASYIISFILIGLVSLIIPSNNVFDLLFGYNLNNVRCFIGTFISIMIMIWIGSGIYYSLRKSKNMLIISNVVTSFVISFIESLICILIAYTGNFSGIELFGMISIRYVFEVIVSIIGLIPVYILVKYLDKKAVVVMRTRKQELVSDDLKPFVCNILKDYREKYNYSLEDLSRAIGYKKNRQTLHKYETGTLNIPYEIFFDIAGVFNISSDIFKEIPMTKEEQELFEKKMIKSYVNTMKGNNNITSRGEKIINTYRNASYEPVSKVNELSIRLLDDSMSPVYLKGDRVFFRKKDKYNNGDDIVIAVKGNILSVRRLYKSGKAVILQAMNPKYQTIAMNVFSEDMILGKVETMSREIK